MFEVKDFVLWVSSDMGLVVVALVDEIKRKKKPLRCRRYKGVNVSKEKCYL